MWNIPHTISIEMTQKSTIINLGVVDATPASTAGVFDIIDHFHSYVPVLENGEVHPLPTNGDQLDVERAIISFREVTPKAR